MRVVTEKNPIMNCTDLNTFSIKAWMENEEPSSMKMVNVETDQSKVVVIPVNEDKL